MGVGSGTSGKLKDSLYFWYKQWGQVSRVWNWIKGTQPVGAAGAALTGYNF
jgi:hypothetical protein